MAESLVAEALRLSREDKAVRNAKWARVQRIEDACHVALKHDIADARIWAKTELWLIDFLREVQAELKVVCESGDDD